MARFKELSFDDINWDEGKNGSGKFCYSRDFMDWTYVSIAQETAGSDDLWTVDVSGAFLGDENGDIAVFASPEDAFDAFIDTCVLFYNKEAELEDLFTDKRIYDNKHRRCIIFVLKHFYEWKKEHYRNQEEAEKKRREQLEEERRLEDEKWRRKLRQEEYNKKYKW